jgi:hypothetical protein
VEKSLLGLIEPFYPVAGRGRQPYPLQTMLRVHLMQNRFGLSDPGMEQALYDFGHDCPTALAWSACRAIVHARPSPWSASSRCMTMSSSIACLNPRPMAARSCASRRWS